MKRKLVAMSVMLALASINDMGSALGAENISNAKVLTQQALSLPKAQAAVAKSAGYEIKNVKIENTAYRITITVADDTLNDDASKDREPEATQAADAFVTVMNGKAEFSQVVIIHVDYVRSVGNKKAIEAYEFYKTPAGSFVIHKT
jgi:hypothetical protein